MEVPMNLAWMVSAYRLASSDWTAFFWSALLAMRERWMFLEQYFLTSESHDAMLLKDFLLVTSYTISTPLASL